MVPPRPQVGPAALEMTAIDVGQGDSLTYRTDLEGAVTFYLDGETVKPGLPPAEVH